MKKLFILLVLIIITISYSFASKIDYIDLSKEKWEYRWGDSNFDNNIPIWTLDNTDSQK